MIELILVLGLLAVAASLAVPSLSRFFRGRTIDSEARQLLSLTHAGQSRAAADGFPTLLWIDSPENSYGLQEEIFSTATGNSQDVDPKAEDFTLDSTVHIEAVDATPVSVNGHSLPAIRFLPDGTADESSPRSIRLTSDSGQTLWLIQATNRASYAIRNTDR